MKRILWMVILIVFRAHSLCGSAAPRPEVEGSHRSASHAPDSASASHARTPDSALLAHTLAPFDAVIAAINRLNNAVLLPEDQVAALYDQGRVLVQGLPGRFSPVETVNRHIAAQVQSKIMLMQEGILRLAARVAVEGIQRNEQLATFEAQIAHASAQATVSLALISGLGNEIKSFKSLYPHLYRNQPTRSRIKVIEDGVIGLYQDCVHNGYSNFNQLTERYRAAESATGCELATIEALALEIKDRLAAYRRWLTYLKKSTADLDREIREFGDKQARDYRECCDHEFAIKLNGLKREYESLVIEPAVTLCGLYSFERIHCVSFKKWLYKKQSLFGPSSSDAAIGEFLASVDKKLFDLCKGALWGTRLFCGSDFNSAATLAEQQAAPDLLHFLKSKGVKQWFAALHAEVSRLLEKEPLCCHDMHQLNNLVYHFKRAFKISATPPKNVRFTFAGQAGEGVGAAVAAPHVASPAEREYQFASILAREAEFALDMMQRNASPHGAAAVDPSSPALSARDVSPESVSDNPTATSGGACARAHSISPLIPLVAPCAASALPLLPASPVTADEASRAVGAPLHGAGQ